MDLKFEVYAIDYIRMTSFYILYPLEYILRDATGPEGAFIGNFGHPTSVIVDYPFVTGRSTPDSYLTGRKLIEVLDGSPPLRRWGW
jgi:hypothetical protein